MGPGAASRGMRRRDVSRVSAGDWLVLAVCLVLSVGLMLSPEGFRRAAASSLSRTLMAPYRLFGTYAVAGRGVWSECDSLAIARARLRLDSDLLREVRRENKALSEAAGFMASADLTLQPARVVGRGGSRFGEVLEVELGVGDAAGEGAPVISADGVVGCIETLRDGAALVRTLRDAHMRLSGMVLPDGHVGMLSWSFRRHSLVLEGVPIHASVSPGDTVVTSGFGRIFPRGLRVGRVQAVRDDPSTLTKRILVRPFADFDRLEIVFVLRARPEEEQ